MVPDSLKGSELEKAILAAGERCEAYGVLSLFRYGVQGVTFGGKTILVPSLPDFGGVLANGRLFNIEAKCVAGASFPLASDHFRDKQYKHLVRTARFGAASYLVIHFAARHLVKVSDPGMTVAVPVDDRMGFWRAYECGDIKSLSREYAQKLGRRVPWVVPKGCRKALPDLLSFLGPASEASLFQAPVETPPDAMLF